MPQPIDNYEPQANSVTSIKLNNPSSNYQVRAKLGPSQPDKHLTLSNNTNTREKSSMLVCLLASIRCWHAQISQNCPPEQPIIFQPAYLATKSLTLWPRLACSSYKSTDRASATSANQPLLQGDKTRRIKGRISASAVRAHQIRKKSALSANVWPGVDPRLCNTP